jgi:hypothetical protein
MLSHNFDKAGVEKIPVCTRSLCSVNLEHTKKKDTLRSEWISPWVENSSDVGQALYDPCYLINSYSYIK